MISTKSFEKSTPQSRKEKGPLVRVEVGPGRYAKMYRADVEKQGLADKVHPADKDKLRRPAGDKVQPAAGDKLQPPAGDKVESPPAVPPAVEPDDFTAIPGVGKATARALVGHGIKTFEQLKAAGTLAYLTPAAMKAIEDWRNG